MIDLVTNDEIDLGTVGTYAIQPAYQYTTGSDATINAYFNVASASYTRKCQNT